MKAEILQLLKNNPGEYLSGEELSRQMQVSRTAIWKHIKMLRQEGYQIDSVPRLGYRLVHSPDKLYAQEIYPLLSTSIIGKQIYHFDRVTSTNERLKELADQGKPEGTVVIAEQQTAGKGRLGRSWFSPPGAGIWCSVLLRPDILPPDASKLTLLGAVAVAEGIELQCNVRLGIKWPNDLLFSGKKVCGLLTEMRAELDSVEYVVLGFGINIKPVAFPEEVKDRAISLEEVTGAEVKRVQLVATILQALEDNYLLFLKQGFRPVRSKWEDYNITLGKRVTVASHRRPVSGIAVGLSVSGGLIVRTDAGVEQELLAGEVTLQK